jgi:hypothetical protein
MAWRRLMFFAVVIVVLYGSAEVVFSTGGPDSTRDSGLNVSRSGNEELIAPSATMTALTPAQEEACGIPSNAPEGSTYTCAFMDDGP